MAVPIMDATMTSRVESRLTCGVAATAAAGDATPAVAVAGVWPTTSLADVALAVAGVEAAGTPARAGSTPSCGMLARGFAARVCTLVRCALPLPNRGFRCC